jgi:ABC-type glutathione transport system ATPase component
MNQQQSNLEEHYPMADDHIDGVVTADDRVVFTTKDLEVYYGEFRAVREVNLDIKQGEITSFIGLRMWQVHSPTVLQPDERSHPVGASQR